ncbi:hypothetical protein IQ07DRAFT_582941 [Pyrenochaeta sp. DS3sAY3a]|nr:hypothetical protein IQ07DRAFT_582941 [Pyrenochaeta sp. DS3sAY3a]
MYSLPMIAPRPDTNLWPSHRANHSYIDSDASPSSPPNAPNQRRPNSHHGPRHTSAFLATLSNDENMIEQRKQNVRRFGAGWLRPPGVAKTLQAMKDEEVEREEQEMMQRREQVMLDLAAAQQDAANQEEREQNDQLDGQDDGGERDLDDEVPDAERSDSEASNEDTDSDTSDHSNDANDTTVPFNEDSFIEGSMLEAEVSRMLEMEEAEMSGVLQDERDLDEDVPEAGSYEHTDSELEDSSDIDTSGLPISNMGSAMTTRSRRSMRRLSGRRSSGRRSSGLPTGTPAVRFAQGIAPVNLGVDLGQGRSSFGMDGSSSILEGSSFLRSSPAGAAAAPRGSLRDRFLGAARGGRRA